MTEELEHVTTEEWQEHREMLTKLKAWFQLFGALSVLAMGLLSWFVKKAIDVPDQNSKTLIAISAKTDTFLHMVENHASSDSHMTTSEKIKTFATKDELGKDLGRIDSQLDDLKSRASRMEGKIDRIIESQ